MGQRSQVVVRYHNKEKVVAKHLQWNYGFYMVNRTYQLLDYLKKSITHEQGEFLKSSYTDNKIVDGNNESKNILTSLIELNLTIGSYCNSYDLIDNQDYTKIGENKFKLDPFNWDNNNGWLFIDIQNKDEKNATIKYCFVKGYEELDDNENVELKPFSIREYYDIKKDYNWNNTFDDDDKKEIESQLKFIDGVDVMTKDELEEFVSTEYDMYE